MWCGGKLEAQFVNEYGLLEEELLCYRKEDWSIGVAALNVFMTSFRRGLLIVLKRECGVGVLRVLWVVDPVF